MEKVQITTVLSIPGKWPSVVAVVPERTGVPNK